MLFADSSRDRMYAKVAVHNSFLKVDVRYFVVTVHDYVGVGAEMLHTGCGYKCF